MGAGGGLLYRGYFFLIVNNTQLAFYYGWSDLKSVIILTYLRVGSGSGLVTVSHR